jgi:hypothetical protein
MSSAARALPPLVEPPYLERKADIFLGIERRHEAERLEDVADFFAPEGGSAIGCELCDVPILDQH